MCIVIDADTFSEVAKDDNEDFQPVRDWIRHKHKVIYGGSEYENHLKNHYQFRRYLRGLASISRTLKVNDNVVDDAEVFLKKIFKLKGYNDHHIVALLFLKGCRIVASHDKGFHRLIKDCCSSSSRMKIAAYVPKLRVIRPKIYQDKSHRVHLNQRDIERCCA